MNIELINESIPDGANRNDYYDLYIKERSLTEALQIELEVVKTQSRAFARELKNIYQHSKVKKKELADTNVQLVK